MSVYLDIDDAVADHPKAGLELAALRHDIERHVAICSEQEQELEQLRSQVAELGERNDRRVESALRWGIGIVCVAFILLAVKIVGLMAYIERMMR